jgi:formylglycine-generating enzyme required for sulfatase activity
VNFFMGSPTTEDGRYDDEGPRHYVRIANQFAVGKFHVTVDQFTAFVKESGYDYDYDSGPVCKIYGRSGESFFARGYSWRNPGYAQAASNPATCLNWEDAEAYASWLSKKKGRFYRLLTESEWEFSARGVTKPGVYPPYYFGDQVDAMCFFGNGIDLATVQVIPEWTDGFRCWDGYAYTSPVGTFKPNAFGLYDMHGNALQWVEDCYHNSYLGAPQNGEAWLTKPCEFRILRGGSFSILPRGLRSILPRGLRSAFRRHSDPTERASEKGFRVARPLAH